jgi:phosphotransferase system enzyme I (PtsI)
VTNRTDGSKPARRRKPRAVRVLRGVAAAPGVAIGRALLLDRGSTQIFRQDVPPERVEQEVHRLEQAVDQAREQLLVIKERLSARAGPEYGFIFDAHLLFLEDKRLVGDAIQRIRKQAVNAEWALSEAARKIERVFAELDDPYLRERLADVSDVHDRMQRNLAGLHHHDLSELNEDVIIVAHSLPPSEAAGLHHEHVVGFVTEVGGQTSHTAIVAKSLGIPAVVGVKDAVANIPSDSLVAIEGRRGSVLVSPNEEALRRYVRRGIAYEARESRLIANRDLPAITLDGVRVHLRANIELIDELATARDHGAEGIGLYRSEFLFLKMGHALPTEDDHYRTYSELVRASAPHPVTIRTIDLGGEKYFHEMLGPGEANPVLGLRAIRLCRTRPEIIQPQLRAILRAGALGPTRIMFPLVTALEEVRTIRTMIDEAKAELRARGEKFDPDMAVGMMVEVPSAAVLADMFAKHVAFFAVGTNDLIQYTLAVDRGNEHVAYLYQPLHPAVLRLLSQTARAARQCGIEVSCCGEMAAHPLHAAMLVGLGIEDLSMDPVSIPGIKEAIRAIRADDVRRLAAQALKMESADQIDALVQERLGPILHAVTRSN